MKLIIKLIVFSLLLTSCYTTKGLSNKISQNPMSLNATTLTGLYENRILGDEENSLWNDLCIHNPDKKQNIAQGNQVFISYTEERSIMAELYQDNVLLDTMVLKGKPKEKFFVIRKGSHFFTLVFITSIQTKKTIIGNDANADLLIAQGISHSTMFLEDEVDNDDEVITGVYMRRGDTRPQRGTLKASN
ncbi:hypothetical protein [Nonlabens sp.]|uniref:hypothetical protein n=1 Tax=Nonlabens sp. TaxID=1888209 RepID=UPI003F6A256C